MTPARLNALYAFVLLGVCTAGYLALGALGRTTIYCELTKSSSDLSPCFKAEVENQNADVLLVGDSSLLYSVRPSVVAEVSGVSSYNLGLVGPAFGFAPERVIDGYLAHNRRPRAIVVYLSPWDVIEPGHIHDRVWYPAGLQVLQHGDWQDLVALVRARPSVLVELPQVVLQSIDARPGQLAGLRAEMERNGGWFDFAGTLPEHRRVLARCPTREIVRVPPEPASTGRVLERLRTRYASQGVPVYLYVAPYANCATDSTAITQAYAGLAHNEPRALPDEYFIDETAEDLGRIVHVNEAGSTAASRLLGEFVARHVPAANGS